MPTSSRASSSASSPSARASGRCRWACHGFTTFEAERAILPLGVQGSGKTLLARAVAREWGLPLLKMEPARLYDKYIGETDGGRLLAWLQDRKAPVFVVATCNDIGQLPPELTSKGRFDEICDPKLFDLAGLYTAFSRGVEVSSPIIVEELKATKPLSVTRARIEDRGGSAGRSERWGVWGAMSGPPMFTVFA